MLIKSLSLKNFQCYSGEFNQNHFEFHNGLNLIIGNNGNGKSKVFDGFYWVLYDQIFDTNRREFTSTFQYGEKLISDKVTRSCDISEIVTTEACLVVESSQHK
ncbi:AAA family ATPase, partial [uncultured Alteromonas sp.]|uniref:AAA family ATPase n=1 Tax=uncultured Alteromonas sp. TaxID=179113 RepID=UPI0030D955E1